LGVDPLDCALGITRGCRQSRERISCDEKLIRNGRGHLGLCRLDGVNAGDVDDFQVGICRVDCPLGDGVEPYIVALYPTQFASHSALILRFIVSIFPSVGQFFRFAVLHGLVICGDFDGSLGDRQRCQTHCNVIVCGDIVLLAVSDFGFAGNLIASHLKTASNDRHCYFRITIFIKINHIVIRHRQRIAIIQRFLRFRIITKFTIRNLVAIDDFCIRNGDADRLWFDDDCISLGVAPGAFGGGDGHD
jgi:hypothetical protein